MSYQAPVVGAFNAKWLRPEEVASSFVPVAQFRQLTQTNNSVLLGPRGCGKTTLLKMLTRGALAQWRRGGRAERFSEGFVPPAFEAIYIPADVRWCYELSSLSDEGAAISIPAQRLMITANTLMSVLGVCQELVADDRSTETDIAAFLIRRWGLRNTLNTLRDVRASLMALASSVRGHLAVSDGDSLCRLFDELDSGFFAHALDAPCETIQIITDHLPKNTAPKRWALCFDELEIAPAWLRTELLEALRSASPHVLLKLTWTPLLPSGLRTNPESAGDFKAIRLWHSHLADPKSFCEDLSREFLRERFPDGNVRPIDLFSRSILACDEEEPADAYERGSTEYAVFSELAAKDDSFAKLMITKGINPRDPVPSSASERDQFFRKVKPVALLRREFLAAPSRGRSRKAVTVYAGREAIYAMTEGNPRWLLGILNDLVDVPLVSGQPAPNKIAYADQARVLNNAARRLLAQIKASPFRSEIRAEGAVSHNLYDFTLTVGTFFNGVIYSSDFPLDPVGSFGVATDTDSYIIAMIEQLLEVGVLVYVGSSPQDVPTKIPGSRFRLSYMLAPIFRLPLRLYRDAPLGDVLSGAYNEAQLDLPFS